HQFVGLLNACLYRLVIAKHHFQLEKLAQIVDPIEMNSGTANHVERSLLHHATDDAMGEAKRLAKRLRVARGRADVERLLRARQIGPAIEDQFSARGREGAQLQPPGAASEEGIVLEDFDRASGGDCRRAQGERRQLVYAGLDLDVPGHWRLRAFTFAAGIVPLDLGAAGLQTHREPREPGWTMPPLGSRLA